MIVNPAFRSHFWERNILYQSTPHKLGTLQSDFQMIDLVYAGFYTQLNDRYTNIFNEKEIKLCCLLKANFSTKEINMLTRQSLQTIYQRKTQIRQKLSIPEADDILHHLA